MNDTANSTSGEDSRPAPISSTSSLDSLVAFTTMDSIAEHGEEIRDSTTVAKQQSTDHSSGGTIEQQQQLQLQHNQQQTNQQTQRTEQQPQHEQLISQSTQEQQQHLLIQTAPVTGAVTPSSVAMSPALAAVASGTAAAASAAAAIAATQAAMPTLLLPPQHLPATAPVAAPDGMISSATVATPAATVIPAVPGSQAPEFLYQLTKMLTDDNRDTIEWNQGKIEVHSPHRLEANVLHKYFRHSKFASFQRQLNYFGFRKQAGKGKMAPCSYVNENLPSTDLSCLLHIKRKTSVSTSAKEKQSKKNPVKSPVLQAADPGSANVNPVLAGILQRSTLVATGGPTGSMQKVESAHQKVAQAAVGRGIRHGYALPSVAAGPFPPTTVSAPVQQATQTLPQPSAQGGVTNTTAPQQPTVGSSNNPLSQLVTNYRNTLNDMSTEALIQGTDPTPLNEMGDTPFTGFLSREDSLIDLAMIPIVDGEQSPSDDPPASAQQTTAVTGDDDVGFNFIDFPNPDVYPSSEAKGSG